MGNDKEKSKWKSTFAWVSVANEPVTCGLSGWLGV